MADEIKILNNVNLYATPTDNIHITTKGYVDTGLSGKADSDHTHTYLKGNGNTTGKFWTPFKSWNTYLVSQSLLFPEFSTTASYSVGDYITLEGVVYKCSTAHSGTWNANHFTATSVKGYVDYVAGGKADVDHDHHVLKTLNNKTISLEGSPSIDTYLVIQDRFVGGFNSNSSYVVGSVVSYVGNFWKCTTAHSGAWDGSHFTKITLKNYIDDVASGKANATHTHSGSDITSGTVGTSYLPAADGTSAGIVSVATNSGLVASSGALSVNVTDGSGLSKNATTGAIAMRTASSSAYGTVRIASSVASDSSYVVPSSLLYSTLQNYVPTTDLTTTGGSGQNGKVVQLNSSGLIDTTMVPKIAVTDTFTASSESGMTSFSNAEQGDICIRTDLSKTYILTNNTPGTASNWKELATPADTVTSVNTKTGAVTLSASDVGASASDHTHYYLKNGNHTATAPTLTVSTYVVIQDKITPSYDSTVTYSLGDTCSRYGRFFRWINANSGANHAPISAASGLVDSTYWEEITILRHIGDNIDLAVAYLVDAEPFDATKTYFKGQRCVYKNIVYVWTGSTASMAGTTPDDYISYWSLSPLGSAAYYNASEEGEYYESGGKASGVPVLLERQDNTEWGTIPECCINVGLMNVSVNDATETKEDWMFVIQYDQEQYASGLRFNDADLGMGGYVRCVPDNGATGAIDHLFVKLGSDGPGDFVELSLTDNVMKSFAAPYDDTVTYSTGDVCSYNGQLYRYKYSTSSSDNAPSDTTYWETTTIKSYVDTGLAGKSATSHTHDKLKSGNYDAYLPNLTTSTRLVVQEKIAPEYNGATTYSKGDACCIYGRLFQWINNTSGSGHPPVPSHSGSVDTTYWEEIKVTGYINSQDTNLRTSLLTENIAETYSSSKTYNYGDICSYNGQIYIWANGSSGSNHLPTDTDYWSEAVVMDSVDIKMSEHTHSSLKNGSYTVSAPTVSSASYVVAQESIVPLYSNTTSYSTGNICSYNGKIYRYKYSTSSSAKLPTNTTYWEETTVKAYVDTGLSGKANSSHSHTASDLPTATTSAKGLVQVGSGLSVSNGVVSVSPSAVSGIMGMGVYTKLANLSTPTVALADDTALYKYTIAGNTTLVFDSSNLTMTSGTAITFELYLVMPATVYTVSFPNTVSWLNNETPSMSTKSKTYMLTFRSIDGGATWLGSKEGCY